MIGKPLIAHVVYRLDTGGMEQILLSIINGTSERYRHVVVCLAGFGSMRDQIQDSTIACISLNKKPGKDWMHYVRFWRLLRALKPDLVQTYNIGTLDLVPIARLAGVRLLIHAEHGRDWKDPRGNNPKYLRLRRWMAPFIGGYVAVSSELQRWLVECVGIRPSRVAYIPNGIDISKFNIAHKQRGPRRLLNDFAPPGTVLVGNVARLDKVKDQIGLISALRLLSEDKDRACASCRLVIAGEGPQRGELQQHIARLGLSERVLLLGNRDDVPALLAECDVFALSSIAEGMPLTLLEAMAARLPVVSTNVGGVSSVVETGKTGTLVPPGDPRALADAIGVYATDELLRRNHGDAGYARVTANYSLGKMIAAYEKLYGQLLGTQNVNSNSISSLTDRKEH